MLCFCRELYVGDKTDPDFFCLCSRIYEILPQRIQQWQQSPCIAEEQGKKLLERIRREQQSARMRLTEMEKRFHELEGIIAKAKQQDVHHDEEVRAFVNIVQCIDVSILLLWKHCKCITIE